MSGVELRAGTCNVDEQPRIPQAFLSCLLQGGCEELATSPRTFSLNGTHIGVGASLCWQSSLGPPCPSTVLDGLRARTPLGPAHLEANPVAHTEPTPQTGLVNVDGPCHMEPCGVMLPHAKPWETAGIQPFLNLHTWQFHTVQPNKEATSNLLGSSAQPPGVEGWGQGVAPWASASPLAGLMPCDL